MCSITYITFISRSDSFMGAYAVCDRTELLMKENGIQIDYKFCRKVIYVLHFDATIGLIYTFVECVISNDPIAILIFKNLTMGIPIIIMTTPIHNYLMFAALLFSRFRDINSLITNQMYVGSTKVNANLTCLAKIHLNLCKCCNMLIYANEYVFLSYYIYTFIQLGIVILNMMGYFSNELDPFDIYWNFQFLCSNAAVIISLTLLKHESLLTGPVLCDLNEAYLYERINQQVTLIL